MSELLGITGPIGSGKSTLATLLCDTSNNCAHYEMGEPVTEVANRLNQLLEAEIHFESADSDIDLINQAFVWMPDIIAEHLHRDITWTHIAIASKDMRAHPEIYEKLFLYLADVRNNAQLVSQPITPDNKPAYRSLLQWLGGYFLHKISPRVWTDELFRRIDLHESFRSLVIVGGIRSASDAQAVTARGGRIIRIVRRGVADTSSDVTESQRSSIVPDITVINNGDLAELRYLAESLWNDIAAGSPKKEYRAA